MNDQESSSAESISSLIDRLADRFENEWRDGKQPRIQDYLREVNDEHKELLAQELDAVVLQLQSEVESSKLADTVSIDQPNQQKSHPKTIGRYSIETYLGGGGFGDVYKAWDDVLHRYVAIKVPRRDRDVRPEHVEQFLREARILANLDHPNVVPVYDFGSLDDGSCFVVSKVVEGANLKTIIEKDRPSHAESASIVADVSRAIHFAHTSGLYHRDIKPENILLDTTGKPFVTDFGLALKSDEISFGPAFAGTAYYMSPEQARAQADLVDGRTDVFALGVVLYELLTGARPFTGSSPAEVAQRILRQEARPPRQIDDKIPKVLEAICLKALSKKPSDRYTTALDLADDVEAFLDRSDEDVGNPGESGFQLDLKLGRYRLQFSLGRGGFGQIYQGIDTATGSAVVVKEQRFSDEAEAARICDLWHQLPRLQHPNIVTTLDVGHEDGVVLVVQEHVAGQTLSGHQSSEVEAAELCRIVARALHYSHSKGIVHGDLKPSHIVVDDVGRPHVLNLPWMMLFTREGVIAGTPSYMSPEQAKGKPATSSSDVYSIGVILFELLTGGLPFRGPGGVELLQQIADEEPERPRSIDSRISKDLEAVCLRCLEKDPLCRYESANQLANELQRFLNGQVCRSSRDSMTAAAIEIGSGPNQGQKFDLAKDRVIVGRHPDCDIHLNVPAMSRRHVQFVKLDNGYAIEDLGTRNGTYVNGNLVPYGERLVLSNGDSIHTGAVILVYRCTENMTES